MNFSTADKVYSVLEDMRQADLLRATNRALINDLFNGVPPYTKEEEEENHILVNVNWKEGATLLHTARRSYENAFLKPGNYFTVHLEQGPDQKRMEWSRIITRNVNRPLKRSLAFMEAYRSKFAGVVLHGVGPMAWEDKYCWCPYTFGIEDLLIPTDTYTTLENLSYFAIRKPMKPGKLFDKTFGLSNPDPGWDMEAVAKILDSYHDINQTAHQWNWSDHPEKMAELYKQNASFYDGDSAPTIYFWDFYYQREGEAGQGWSRCLLLDNDYVPAQVQTLQSPVRFIYQSDNFAKTLDEVLHIQYGDGNNKPPFMHHSVRSIGYLLYDVVSMMNRLRCSFTEHVFEQMMMLFRVADPNDRSRIEKLLLMNKGIIPEGASIVPAGERYQVDQNLIQGLLGNFKQLMSESTAAYTQDIDDGTQKEKTATEVMAQVNSINALTATLISYAYLREAYAYREICRRFCIKNNPEPAVKKFRQQCINDGVPEQYLDVEMWEIEPERVLGGGNKVLEVAQAKELQQMRPQLNPDAQLEVDRIAIAAYTDDEKLANRLVPYKKTTSDATHDAQLAFGTLMAGGQVDPRSGLNEEDQITALLKAMVQKVQMIMQTGGVGTPQDVIGLQNAAKYTQGHIQILAGDKAEKQKVRQFMQVLGKIMNEVKGFQQRQQEAAKKAAQEQNQDPAAAAKIQLDAAAAKQKMQLKQAADQQKLGHKQLAFQTEQHRKNIETGLDIARENARTKADIQNRERESRAKAAATPRAFEDE